MDIKIYKIETFVLKIKCHFHRIIVNYLSKHTSFNELKLVLFLSKYPRFYYSYYSFIDPGFPELAIRRDTQLVIEGFPRSANTFAVVAFQYAQPVKIQIAHHLHVPAQVIRAAQWGIPAIVLIRRPKDAVASLLVRHPELEIRQVLRWYITFYKALYKYRASCVIATFEQVIEDYSLIVQRLNEQFGTDFIAFTPKGSDLNNIFAEIEVIEPSETKSCKPSAKKDELKMPIMHDLDSLCYQNLLKEAEEIYTKYLLP
jgi:hypothetical protein